VIRIREAPPEQVLPCLTALPLPGPSSILDNAPQGQGASAIPSPVLPILVHTLCAQVNIRTPPTHKPRPPSNLGPAHTALLGTSLSPERLLQQDAARLSVASVQQHARDGAEVHVDAATAEEADGDGSEPERVPGGSSAGGSPRDGVEIRRIGHGPVPRGAAEGLGDSRVGAARNKERDAVALVEAAGLLEGVPQRAL